jgi:hypothetical protein
MFASDVRDTHTSKWAVTQSAEWAEWDRMSPEPARYTLTLANVAA